MMRKAFAASIELVTQLAPTYYWNPKAVPRPVMRSGNRFSAIKFRVNAGSWCRYRLRPEPNGQNSL